MTPPDPQRTFETEIRIAAPRDAVWEAIATDRGLRRWFAPETTFEARPGGEVVWDWGGHHRWAQRIEILEPGARLRTRYDSSVDDGEGGKKPLFIEFLLAGEGGTTTLRVVQSGFGSEAGFDEEYDGISRGWPVELRSLRLHLERHAGRDRRLAWSSLQVELDPDAAWRRLVGPEGLACGESIDRLAEGERFDFESAAGDRFGGTVLARHPRELCADLESHGGAFLRVTVDVWGGTVNVWCWLGAYDRDPADMAGLQERWDRMLATLFSDARIPAPAGGR